MVQGNKKSFLKYFKYKSNLEYEILSLLINKEYMKFFGNIKIVVSLICL